MTTELKKISLVEKDPEPRKKKISQRTGKSGDLYIK